MTVFCSSLSTRVTVGGTTAHNSKVFPALLWRCVWYWQGSCDSKCLQTVYAERTASYCVECSGSFTRTALTWNGRGCKFRRAGVWDTQTHWRGETDCMILAQVLWLRADLTCRNRLLFWQVAGVMEGIIWKPSSQPVQEPLKLQRMPSHLLSSYSFYLKW